MLFFCLQSISFYISTPSFFFFCFPASGTFDLSAVLEISKALQNSVLDLFDVFFGTQSNSIHEWATSIVDKVLAIAHRYKLFALKDDSKKGAIQACVIETTQDEKADMLKIFDVWTVSMASKIANVLIPHLTKVQNASEIAHSQQAIWKACIHYDESKTKVDKSFIHVTFSQAHLDDACEYMLNQKFRQKPKSVSRMRDSSGGSQLLWVNFFQKSFHEQVK